jgi:hypothetical protein
MLHLTHQYMHRQGNGATAFHPAFEQVRTKLANLDQNKGDFAGIQYLIGKNLEAALSLMIQVF